MAVKSTTSSETAKRTTATEKKKKKKTPSLTQPRRPIDREKIKEGARLILEGIGEDLSREGLRETPERIAEFYLDAFSGISINPAEYVPLYTAENRDELIIVRDIYFFSMCEHHLLPFFGQAHIAYIPGDNKITGFSHFARVIETLAHRPTTQEVLTSQAANAIRKTIKPKGLLIITEAEHLCLTMRGVKKPGSKTITSAIRGCLRRDATRAEAMALIKGNG